MGRKSAQGDAQASTENANTEKDNGILTENAAEDAQATIENANIGKQKGISTENAVAEDAQASTENANTGKEKGISTENRVDDDSQASTKNANTRKEYGISTESATAEDTKNKLLELYDTSRKIDIWPPWDSDRVERVLRSQGASTSGDKGKGKEVLSVDDSETATENTNTEEEIGDSWDGDRVPRSQGASASSDMIEGKKVVKIDDKAMEDAIGSLVKELTLMKSHNEELVKVCDNALAVIDGIEAAKKAKEKNSAAEGAHATTEDSQASTENANTGNENGISTENAAAEGAQATTENPNIEKEIGDPWDSDRSQRSQGVSTSGSTGEGNEVVRVGDKAYADAIRYLANLLQRQMATSEEAGEGPSKKSRKDPRNKK